MGEETLFTKIIEGKIPADKIYEDTQCIAFRDINPQAPVHFLVVPRKVITKLSEATPSDQSLLGHLLLVAKRLAKEMGVQDGFRLVINSGADAGQTVFHLHVHVLAGRTMSWPPG
ncbi:MAG: histidine triad nucleotide-binding protein [Spirochaetia bacterium]|nr:histidine triad nucleotide-binding protein [Spirochaetia bacterium]